MFIAYHRSANRIVIHIDNTHPDAWRMEPHYSDIKLMAKSIYPRNGQVVIVTGLEAVAMLPDRDKPLGAYRDDKIFVTTETPGPAGPVYDVFLFEKDDPQLAALRQQAGAVIDRTAPGK